MRTDLHLIEILHDPQLQLSKRLEHLSTRGPRGQVKDSVAFGVAVAHSEGACAEQRLERLEVRADHSLVPLELRSAQQLSHIVRLGLLIWPHAILRADPWVGTCEGAGGWRPDRR
jgi:hypothetical protein